MAAGPNLQYFAESGIWAKPERAVRVDIVLQGAGSGAATQANLGTLINPFGYIISNGERGEIRVSSFDADDLPGTVSVTVGKGGRPGGRDGYAVIITHLEEPEDLRRPPETPQGFIRQDKQ